MGNGLLLSIFSGIDLLGMASPWLPIKDGDARALGLYRRHYSRRIYADGRKPRLFVGPGEKMVLLTPSADGLFVWRKFIDQSGQHGVNCAVFRYEGGRQCHNGTHAHSASYLIRAACELAWRRWPGERLYTYVDPRKVRSANPGYCFKRAGWRFCGRTKGGLHILECAMGRAVARAVREATR